MITAMTKGELIRALMATPHEDDTPVCIYLSEEEELEDVIGDIAFIESLDESIEDRIDLNTIYKSVFEDEG